MRLQLVYQVFWKARFLKCGDRPGDVLTLDGNFLLFQKQVHVRFRSALHVLVFLEEVLLDFGEGQFFVFCVAWESFKFVFIHLVQI